MKEIFIYSILKNDKKELLLANRYKLDFKLCIIKKDYKIFSVKKKHSKYLKTQLVNISRNIIIDCQKIIQILINYFHVYNK